MIVSDWITAHRIDLGMYTCTTPRRFFVDLEMAERLLGIVTLTRGIEITLYQGFVCQSMRHSRLD